MAAEFIHKHETGIKISYHPRHALTRRCLLVHVELTGHTVGQTCLVLELWAQPCSRQPLASRLAVRTAIGARVGHHIHLVGSEQMTEVRRKWDRVRDRKEQQRDRKKIRAKGEIHLEDHYFILSTNRWFKTDSQLICQQSKQCGRFYNVALH